MGAGGWHFSLKRIFSKILCMRKEWQYQHGKSIVVVIIRTKADILNPKYLELCENFARNLNYVILRD